MSNDANALKRKEQIKKILVYGGMVMLCLVSFYFIFSCFSFSLFLSLSRCLSLPGYRKADRVSCG